MSTSSKFKIATRLPIAFQTMVILNGTSDLAQVGTDPVISIAQQMAFYFSVSQSAVLFDSSDDDSCTVQIDGAFYDVSFCPETGIVIDWFSA